MPFSTFNSTILGTWSVASLALHLFPVASLISDLICSFCDLLVEMMILLVLVVLILLICSLLLIGFRLFSTSFRTSSGLMVVLSVASTTTTSSAGLDVLLVVGQRLDHVSFSFSSSRIRSFSCDSLLTSFIIVRTSFQITLRRNQIVTTVEYFVATLLIITFLAT